MNAKAWLMGVGSLLLLLAPHPLHAAEASGAEAVARGFIAELAKGDYGAAASRFDGTMSAALPAGKLEATWKQVVGQYGALVKIEHVQVSQSDKYAVAAVACAFERTRSTLRITADASGHIAGFFVGPPEAPWAPPSYAATDRFVERAVQVGSAPALPGTLTLPKGAGPFPAVVLVHGSGPNDRDETLEANKIFKDLAWGLASRGVAVLRYDKRTRVDPKGVKTVKEEVLDGARAAIDLLASQKEIDPKRIAVLGHSQGGNLAPRIAAGDARVRGIAILAGETRPFEDLLLEQTAYFAHLQPSVDATDQIKGAQAFKQKVEDPNLKPDEMIGGILGTYFLDLRGYDAAKVAAALTIPILVLQGGRDYQVSPKLDFEGWKKALAGKPNAKLELYPALNHLFIAGTGPSTPAEYGKPGHVSVEVIDDLASWIKGAPIAAHRKL